MLALKTHNRNLLTVKTVTHTQVKSRGEEQLKFSFMQNHYLLLFYTVIITQLIWRKYSTPVFHSYSWLNLHFAIKVSEAEVLTELLIINSACPFIHRYQEQDSLTAQSIRRQEKMDFSERKNKEGMKIRS